MLEIGHKGNCNEYSSVLERKLECGICIFICQSENVFCLDCGFAAQSKGVMLEHKVVTHTLDVFNCPVRSGRRS